MFTGQADLQVDQAQGRKASPHFHITTLACIAFVTYMTRSIPERSKRVCRPAKLEQVAQLSIPHMHTVQNHIYQHQISQQLMIKCTQCLRPVHMCLSLQISMSMPDAFQTR